MTVQRDEDRPVHFQKAIATRIQRLSEAQVRSALYDMVMNYYGCATSANHVSSDCATIKGCNLGDFPEMIPKKELQAWLEENGWYTYKAALEY